jgi:hypothetical protein
MPVKACFMIYEKEDDEAGGQAHGETYNVNRCKEFVAAEVSDSGFEIIVYHFFHPGFR